MAKATIANGTIETEPVGAIHLTLQGKGGVGKSLVASILAQYLRDKGREVRCIDTDPVNRTFAQYGALGEDGSYRTVRAEVVSALGSPIARTDPLLRIRGLALLGNIDLNTNTVAALEDWNEILTLAKKIGDQKWENRARGELGLVAGVNGDIGTAGLTLYAAITKAEQLGDVAAHITFATWLANGMANRTV